MAHFWHYGTVYSTCTVTLVASTTRLAWAVASRHAARPAHQPGLPRGLVNNAAPRDGAAPALSALSLDGVDLTPQFAAATVNYTATVAADVDEVTVTATPAVSASVMLAPADADTALDTLTLTGATLAPAFTANVHDYAATVAATAAHTGTEHVTLDLTTASTDLLQVPRILFVDDDSAHDEHRARPVCSGLIYEGIGTKFLLRVRRVRRVCGSAPICGTRSG